MDVPYLTFSAASPFARPTSQMVRAMTDKISQMLRFEFDIFSPPLKARPFTPRHQLLDDPSRIPDHGSVGLLGYSRASLKQQRAAKEMEPNPLCR
jgi:hypothetical protein